MPVQEAVVEMLKPRYVKIPLIAAWREPAFLKNTGPFLDKNLNQFAFTDASAPVDRDKGAVMRLKCILKRP